MRLARDLQYESYVDGQGIRMVLWNQGCKVHCLGCHNPETWDETQGYYFLPEWIEAAIVAHKKGHQGITLTGGDPFLQSEENAEIAKFAHKEGLDVWAYCGLTFEEILKDDKKKILLQECDVLVDGPFILAERDISLPFRGSRNQRIIDVKQSLKYNKVVLLDI